jgi:hypothetical protein
MLQCLRCGAGCSNQPQPHIISALLWDTAARLSSAEARIDVLFLWLKLRNLAFNVFCVLAASK